MLWSKWSIYEHRCESTGLQGVKYVLVTWRQKGEKDWLRSTKHIWTRVSVWSSRGCCECPTRWLFKFPLVSHASAFFPHCWGAAALSGPAERVDQEDQRGWKVSSGLCPPSAGLACPSIAANITCGVPVMSQVVISFHPAWTLRDGHCHSRLPEGNYRSEESNLRVPPR